MVLIIGSGIAGASTAYYLSQYRNNRQLGHTDVTILDAVGPGACSKAAAFLSESWGDGTKTEKIHRKSYQLHLELADKLSLKSFQEDIPTYHKCDLENWTKKKLEEVGGEGGRLRQQLLHDNDFETKQGRHALVDPQELVTSLIEHSGANVLINEVLGLEMNTDDELVATGVELKDGTIHQIEEDEPIVIALGPWTSRLEDWIPKSTTTTPIPIPIDGVLSTSIVWEDHTPFETPMALFCEEDMRGCHLEIFQRVDGSFYVSGLGNSKPIKASQFRSPQRPIPGQEAPSNINAALRSLRQAQLVPQEEEEEASTRPPSSPDLCNYDVRACIRPMSPDGVPLVGKIIGGGGDKKKSNLYVATGGGQWGITWGPLMGQILAQQIMSSDQEPPPLSSNLRPGRFDTVVQRSLMQRRTKEAWSQS